jgi:hypothetical protein
MGKRGRPSKKKPLSITVPNDEQCYTILSSDEEVTNKEEILRLPSPSQRRGTGNEWSGASITTPSSDCQTSSADVNEKPTTLTRNNNGKKKIVLNGIHKKDDASGDSDATEVYVQHFFLLLRNSSIEFSVRKSIIRC